MRRATRIAFLALAVSTLSAQAPPPSRQVVERSDALPLLTYQLPLPPSRMIRNASRMAALAAEVEQSSRRLLEGYDIRDAATRRELLVARRTAALVSGDLAAALAFGRAAGGGSMPDLSTDLLVAALSTSKTGQGSGDAEAARLAVRARLDARNAAARSGVVALRRDLALASSAFRLGEITSFADPQWQRSPAVGQEFAVALLRLWAEINLRNPKLDLIEPQLERWLARHPATGINIWPARDFGVDQNRTSRVAVAVWDGIDPTVFRDHLSAGSGDRRVGSEEVGLAFDERFLPTSGVVMPVPASLAGSLPDYERYKRGVGDLAAGLNNSDVAFARAWRRRLAPADIKAFEEGYGFYVNYVHGTQVAGVALQGLSRARLIPVRITFSNASPSPLLDEAAAHRFSDMAAAATRYMGARGVRVCNISWGFTAQDIEGNLNQHGIEPDAAIRARRAARIFDIMLAGMTRAIANSPDILFVVSAGNSSQDVDFVRDLPGSINLGNVLTVGAADAQGRLASFASTGASIDLYAHGTDVESLVPGGGRVRASGASLAAPQVVNAAAKLLVVRPDLRAPDLARLLTDTASPVPGSELRLLDPRAALARLNAGTPRR